MGEIADQIIDQMIYGGTFRIGRKGKPKSFQAGSGNFMWRTATGEVVSMRDMTTEHVQNALRVCEANGNTGKAKQLHAVLRERGAS